MGVNGRLHSLIFLCTLFWVTSSWSDQNYGPFSNSKLASNAAHPKNIARIFKPYVSIARLDLVLQINQYEFIVQALQYVHIQIFSDPKSNLSKSTGSRQLGSTSRWSHPPRIQNKISLDYHIFHLVNYSVSGRYLCRWNIHHHTIITLSQHFLHAVIRGVSLPRWGWRHDHRWLILIHGIK